MAARNRLSSKIILLVEAILLITKDLTIERCKRGRKRIRQTAAHDQASQAYVPCLPVRQQPISVPGAHKSTSYAPTGRVNVRQFGEMRILSEGEARPGVFEGAEPLHQAMFEGALPPIIPRGSRPISPDGHGLRRAV